ncbi:Mitotic checkpoint protein [Fulvia fulva]|uniref:Mitotic checkpoint protein n=1 Tax=Passalora fulva TaxID=5499 RepID=A0A9Q8USA3_PASFU|nr:Mitotic checkpoint protein [Fulvia fulva]KAK4617642.1 Mitotic checkpoint protein [Fulvia fulva]KAK4618379.1 Mitotic checkpoint protein [Fulvia fulva]UJO20562.1 Mitotic checkpoint protein [Fulvia fulva]WPV18276.1 Mitotic checkpoint protein [Fulvia fulva]WPV33207.1 Mitotic checkpoint protein [Fulvia fulva]
MGAIDEIAYPPVDAISSIRYSPDGNTLLVGAWDSNIHIYTRNGEAWQLSSKIPSEAPILDLAWNADSTTFYAVGLGHEVVSYTANEGESSRVVLSTHSQAANKVAYSAQHHILLSTSWDGTLHIHEPPQNGAAGRYVSVELPAKPFALSLTTDRAVVVMAERKVHVYDLQALSALVPRAGDTTGEQQAIAVTPWQTRDSNLKFMARDLACMPSGEGFAASSIEGRVSVEWFDPVQNENAYAFKCHREKTTVKTEEGEDKPLDVIYPVNAIAFHPEHGSFATGGGDGVVALWDAKTKRRIRQYPKLPASVLALEFSGDGKELVIGISPGFEDGQEDAEPNPELIKIFVRTMGPDEAKGKPAKK